MVAVAGSSQPVALTLAPNPSAGPVLLTLTTAAATLVQGTVSSVLGAEVFRFARPVGAGTHTIDLDLSGQPAGVSLLRIQTPQGPQTLRVIKR